MVGNITFPSLLFLPPTFPFPSNRRNTTEYFFNRLEPFSVSQKTSPKRERKGVYSSDEQTCNSKKTERESERERERIFGS